MITKSSGMKISEDNDLFDHRSLWADNFEYIDKKVHGIKNIYDYENGGVIDQTAMVNAISDCFANGYALNWGNDGKTFVSTASILNFHSVKHIGNAMILRGTDTFYINPRGTQRNRIYVKPTGSSNTFDGLSSTTAVAKLQTAMDYIENYGALLGGFWEINVGAGTTANHLVIQAGLLSENPIEINGVDVGGHPNVPTSIISEGAGKSASGIMASYGTRILVQNIKIVGYNGTSSSCGIAISHGSTVTTNNVHTDQCYWGISGQKGRVIVPDGIHSNNGFLVGQTKTSGTGACIRSLMHNYHYIGDQNGTSVIPGAIFKDSSYGFFAQEWSTGHVNWVTIQDCLDGARATVGSRINGDGILFKRNTRDIRVDANSHFGNTSNVVYSTGVDVSGTTIVRANGGQLLDSYRLSGYEMGYSLTENIYDVKDVNTTYNQTTAQTFHSTVFKNPHWRITPSTIVLGRKVEFKIFGSLNGTANNKRIQVRWDDGTTFQTASLIFTASETGTFVAEGCIYILGNTNQYLELRGSRHLGTGVRHSGYRVACDMSKDITLSLQCYTDDTTLADNVKIDIVEMKVAG
jgi:hypothetical protein